MILSSGIGRKNHSFFGRLRKSCKLPREIKHFFRIKKVSYYSKNDKFYLYLYIFFLTEIARVQSGRPGSGNGSSSGYREPIKYVDVYRERPIRLTVRVLVPVREHPKV